MPIHKNPLISVISPSLNSKRHIAQAIESVNNQSYKNFEHIVVDGGSTDGTQEVLSQYAHLRWVSEPDAGQADAMNKGYEMARGEILVYLNSDDYFLPEAFDAVVGFFNEGASFVVGQIKILKPNGTSRINDPKVTFSDMARWWELDAFCYNSAGYFYRREVQESVGPFNILDHYHMDYEFLMEAALKFELIKIQKLLACFRLLPGTKTFENSENEIVTFSRFRKYVQFLDNSDRKLHKEQYRAYLTAYTSTQ